MSNAKYTYAVARIRALETKLFNQAVIDQLIGCATEEECIQVLEEKGWGDQETSGDPEGMLTREEEKTWETIREMGVDMSVFDVLSYPNLFHNLKAAIKQAASERAVSDIFIPDTQISGEEMLDIISDELMPEIPLPKHT